MDCNKEKSVNFSCICRLQEPVKSSENRILLAVPRSSTGALAEKAKT